MARFNIDEYETVETRLDKFWTDHPEGRVLTEREINGVATNQWVVKASVYFDRADERPTATGYAEEVVTERGVNQTSALENCETSAIGRALANCGYAAKGKRPSREEMEKVQRGAQATVKPVLDEEHAQAVREACEYAVSLTDQQTLRELWKTWSEFLDADVQLADGSTTTLKAVILARKAELEVAA